MHVARTATEAWGRILLVEVALEVPEDVFLL